MPVRLSHQILVTDQRAATPRRVRLSDYLSDNPANHPPDSRGLRVGPEPFPASSAVRIQHPQSDKRSQATRGAYVRRGRAARVAAGGSP